MSHTQSHAQRRNLNISVIQYCNKVLEFSRKNSITIAYHVRTTSRSKYKKTNQLPESCPVIGLKVPEKKQKRKQGKKIEDSINGRALINKYIHKQDGKKGIESQTHVKPKPMV